MRRSALLLASLLALAVPASADAAITVTQPLTSWGDVLVTGTSGADDVVLRGDDGKLRIEDPSGVVAPLSGICAKVSGGRVECTTSGTPKVSLGGGNDEFEIEDGYEGPRPTVYGQGGDDVVEVGASYGAPADGGSGSDTISYRRFDDYDGLGIDLASGTNTWGDMLTGFEHAEGSPREDYLWGDEGPNRLNGGGGDDHFDGRGGADALTGGDGDDQFSANDGALDVISCFGGYDAVYGDQHDTNVGGQCEAWNYPGKMYPQPASPQPTTMYPTGTAMPRTTYPRSAPRVIKAPRGKRGTISVASRPAADAGRTRIGTRIRTSLASKVRMTVKHGDRVIGTAEATGEDFDEVVVQVPLDAAVKQAIAKTRHVELAAIVELETGGTTVAAEEFQATIAEPPPFVLGAKGVTRRGGFGVQTLKGTGRGDRLQGESGDDRLLGRSGNDDLHGGTGNDRLQGSSGNDRLDGYDGDDTLEGGAGDDLIIESRFGDDTLSGGAGNDWIVGGRGTDHISGGAGDDVIFGNSGSDSVDCGAGNDTVFVNLESERASARGCETILDEDDIPSIKCPEAGTADGETMLGSDEADLCKGEGGDDDVEGAGGSDKLYGGAGADRLFGRFGNDQMFGEDGDDELEGGRGDDRLSGGAGNDQLNGGYGRDRVDAGPGDDTVVSRGGGRDQVDCGPGRDVVTADRTDKLSGCETVRWK